jgi:hypothetical protein
LGVGIGSAAVAGALAGHAAAVRLSSFAARLLAGYVAAFLAYKGVLALWSLVLGGIGIALSPSITASQFAREAAILAGLLVLYRALTAIGVPAAQRPALA